MGKNRETGPEREGPQKNLQWQPNTDQEMIANKLWGFKEKSIYFF